MQTIGILAFQGDVIEHVKIIEELGHKAKEVRSLNDIKNCAGLIIPGGESTTIGFFLEQSGLLAEIRRLAKEGFPIFGTCAGAILMAKKITGDKIPPGLDLMDIEIRRNAYGKQIDSFYANLQIPELKIKKLQTAFIRAPIIEKTGPKVRVLAKHNNRIVLVRQNNLLAATFHPELRADCRLHEYFMSMTAL
jgi:pyridoxal 5'-phosphate synthase pdxT subunit